MFHTHTWILYSIRTEIGDSAVQLTYMTRPQAEKTFEQWPEEPMTSG